MLPSALYDPSNHATPSQRLEAAARRERQQRFEQSARTIASVREVVEMPVDKTERTELPIVPEPELEVAPDPIPDWVDRQRRIYKTPWFSIVDEIDASGKKIISILEIQRAVCKYFSVSRVALLSARRTTDIVRPRQVAMYLCKNLTPKSLPEIGRRFGDKDHTTVIHAVRRTAGLRATDETLNSAVLTLAASLGGVLA